MNAHNAAIDQRVQDDGNRFLKSGLERGRRAVQAIFREQDCAPLV